MGLSQWIFGVVNVFPPDSRRQTLEARKKPQKPPKQSRDGFQVVSVCVFQGWSNCLCFLWSKYRVIRNTQTINPNQQFSVTWWKLSQNNQLQLNEATKRHHPFFGRLLRPSVLNSESVKLVLKFGRRASLKEKLHILGRDYRDHDEWWMMNDEWWMMNDEWWMMNDEWWMMNDDDDDDWWWWWWWWWMMMMMMTTTMMMMMDDEWWMMNDEWWMMNDDDDDDEWWMMNDEW